MRARGRFAPSPTGDLHLGGVATALFCAASIRRAGGTLALRMEDLDRPRVVPGKDAAILEDLTWLGIRWDERPVVQSERLHLYEAALATLAEQGLTYLCDCSRAEIARVASAPHAGEDGPRYPETCRPFGMHDRAFRRPPAVRLAVPRGAVVELDDLVLGPLREDVGAETGDFVLQRGDGVFSYQLAVVVDDLAMGITEVVRGGDLASSAPRQALLANLLGGEAPRFGHIPLLLGPDGERLAKRAPGITVRDQRASGRSARDLVRAIARAYAHEIGDAADPVAALAEVLDLRKLRGLRVTQDGVLDGARVG